MEREDLVTELVEPVLDLHRERDRRAPWASPGASVLLPKLDRDAFHILEKQDLGFDDPHDLEVVLKELVPRIIFLPTTGERKTLARGPARQQVDSTG
jgi:hypothetical protein